MQDERIVSGLQLADPNCGRRGAGGEICTGGSFPPVFVVQTPKLNGEVPSSLSYLLQPEGSGTKMTLVHTKLPQQMAGGYTPGWHAYLDRLDRLIAGTDPSSWDELFNAIAPRYMPQYRRSMDAHREYPGKEG
jgi:hypothetical protein